VATRARSWWAPPGGPQGRLLASILGALPGAPLAVLLEPRLGLDVDGLPLTCLRRDLVAAGPQRALCEDLIARADWLAAHDLDGPDDWRWVTAPGPQPRLLSMTADSPQDAARALVQRALEAREGAATLQLPQDLNVALVVLCKPTEQGAALELFTFPDRPLSATGALFLRPLSLLSAARPAAPSPAPEATPAPPPVVEPPPPPVVAAPAPPPVVEPPVPPLAVEAPTLTPTPPAPPLQAVAAPAPTPPEAPARPPRPPHPP
jgi:hypothetical protein